MGKKKEIYHGELAALNGARMIFDELYGSEKTEEFWGGACADYEKTYDPRFEKWTSFQPEEFCTHFSVRLWNEDWEQAITLDIGVFVSNSWSKGWGSSSASAELHCARTQGLEGDDFDPETAEWHEFCFVDESEQKGFGFKPVVPKQSYDRIWSAIKDSARLQQLQKNKS